MAPGTNLEEILEIVEDLGCHYDQIVIVGYPPFVKTVLDEGTRRGIDWKALHVKIGLGGEGYSEPWREHVASMSAWTRERRPPRRERWLRSCRHRHDGGPRVPGHCHDPQDLHDNPELAEALFRDSTGRPLHPAQPAAVQPGAVLHRGDRPRARVHRAHRHPARALQHPRHRRHHDVRRDDGGPQAARPRPVRGAGEDRLRSRAGLEDAVLLGLRALRRHRVDRGRERLPREHPGGPGRRARQRRAHLQAQGRDDARSSASDS